MSVRLLSLAAIGGCVPFGFLTTAATYAARGDVRTAERFDPPPSSFRPQPQTSVDVPLDRTPLPARAFDAPLALAALHAVDVSGCGRGARVRATVTFEPSGAVGNVAIDERAPADVRECLTDRIRAAQVDAFSGERVSAGVTYVLR